jgi:hypothetical protein
MTVLESLKIVAIACVLFVLCLQRVKVEIDRAIRLSLGPVITGTEKSPSPQLRRPWTGTRARSGRRSRAANKAVLKILF